MKDFYKILGVKESATPDEIKKAYRKLSLKYHPDRNEGDKDAESKFLEIKEAYETLINQIERSVYDVRKRNYTNTGKTYTRNGSIPEIIFFKADKPKFKFDEIVTFSWKTVNADTIELKPFGIVPAQGQKSFRIKDYKNNTYLVELIAKAFNAGVYVSSHIALQNETYQEMFLFFKHKIDSGDSPKAIDGQNEQPDENKNLLLGLLALIGFVIFISLVTFMIGYLAKKKY